VRKFLFVATIFLELLFIFPVDTFAELNESHCRPTMAQAMDQAKSRCVIWGICKSTVDITAEVIAENPQWPPQKVVTEVKKQLGDSFDRSGAILLMAELGMLNKQ
jgi:hypothetical protein